MSNVLPGHDSPGPTLWNREATAPQMREKGAIEPRRHTRPQQKPPSLKVYLGMIRKAGGVLGSGSRRCSPTTASPGRAPGAKTIRAAISPHLQRVAVKSSVSANVGSGSRAVWKAYANYLERAEANLERSGFSADKDQESLKPIVQQWHKEQDACIYKLVLSPENPMPNPKEFAREFMREMEAGLGTKLEWFGAVHTNTTHTHVHLAIRARDDRGHTLTLSQKYRHVDSREIAMRVATNHIGYRPVIETPMSQSIGHARAQRVAR